MREHSRLVFVVLFLAATAFAPAVGSWQGERSNDKAQSTISYVLKHPFHTVTGRSRQVSSTIQLGSDSKTIQAVTVSAPVTSFDSGNKTRDKDMRKVMDAATYPQVQFTSSRVTPAGSHLVVEGSLYFHGRTQPISFEAKQQFNSRDMIVEGAFPVSLESFAVTRPSIFGLAVEDVVTIRFHMVYPLSAAGT